MIRTLLMPARLLIDFVASVGQGALFFVRLCLQGIAALRRPHLVVDQIHFIGNYSLSIIMVSGLLVGFILGLQGYYTLRRFGSEETVGLVVALSLVRELGPMDEGYFLYFEDAEYCLRARRAGWRIRRAPQAVAVHFRGGSGPVKALARARKRGPEYYYRSRSRFLTQAHGRGGLIAANLAWHAGRALAQTRRLLGKPVNPAVEREGRDLWIGANRPLDPFHPQG